MAEDRDLLFKHSERRRALLLKTATTAPVISLLLGASHPARAATYGDAEIDPTDMSMPTDPITVADPFPTDAPTFDTLPTLASTAAPTLGTLPTLASTAAPTFGTLPTLASTAAPTFGALPTPASTAAPTFGALPTPASTAAPTFAP